MVVIFPGLLSAIEDHYHRTFIDMAEENGYDWVLINYRGIKLGIDEKNGLPLGFYDFLQFREPLRYILK